METSVDEQQMKDDNVPNAESVFIGAVNHCERGTTGTRRKKRRNVDQRAGKEETERALEGLQRETGPPRAARRSRKQQKTARRTAFADSTGAAGRVSTCAGGRRT